MLLALRDHVVAIASFALANARACLFPVFIFVALAVSHALPASIARYDFLLAACVAMQVAMIATGLETVDELKVVTLFHLLGLALELFKVHVGSWAYPEDAFTKIAGVPAYAGFMYASVASYMIQAWRLLDVRIHRWPRSVVVAVLGTVVYANFFTHHVLPDVRFVAIATAFVVFGRTWVEFTVPTLAGRPARRRAMPLVATFAAIGFFVWVAENVATFLGAWQYPHQSAGWHPVDPWKLTSWSLLVIVSLMAVVELKRLKVAREGAPRGRDRRSSARPAPPRSRLAEHRRPPLLPRG